MTVEDEIISQGRDAWSRLQAHERTSWADWCAVGRAILIGRRDAMLDAKANTPFGMAYNRAMGKFLRENGLDAVCGQDRHKIIRCLECELEIESWRSTLTDVQRNRWNHPHSVWLHFSRAFAPGRQVEERKTPRHTVTSSTKRGGMVPNPDQDTIRRIAAELREHWTVDVFKLALVAYHAVMRPAPPPPNPHRAEVPADAAAHEAA